MSLSLITNLLKRLRRSKQARDRFVASQLDKTIAFQIRAMREARNMSQPELAQAIGMKQSGVCRLESPFYGRATLRTLKRIAAAFDVGLIVRFAPFSQMAHWASGSPYLDSGLCTAAMYVPSFADEEKTGVFDAMATENTARVVAVATNIENTARWFLRPERERINIPVQTREFRVRTEDHTAIEIEDLIKGLSATADRDMYEPNEEVVHYA